MIFDCFCIFVLIFYYDINHKDKLYILLNKLSLTNN